MAAIPRAPGFDAKAFSQRLHERVLSATNQPYAVFDPVDDSGNLLGFPRFIAWVRMLRDRIEELRRVVLGTGGLLSTVQTHQGRLDTLSQRVTRLEQTGDLAAIEQKLDELLSRPW